MILCNYNDTKLNIIDSKGNPIKELQAHSNFINDLTLSKDQKFFLTCGVDKTVEVVPPISVEVVPGISVQAVPLKM